MYNVFCIYFIDQSLARSGCRGHLDSFRFSYIEFTLFKSVKVWELPPRLKYRKFLKKRNETKSVGTTAN
ncbi:hypothetical protein A6J42_15855 [Leptospira interrogans serovar Copenhageni]|nr:hypothetical protein A6J42_15855 [Leptospira interrogans serovar Copenhageni]KAA5551696.1 hypothetical protein F3G11_05995 [Leptospira interrogans serovar Copenhageni]WPM71772.1 hypothetical protein FYB70_03950 [Leptospira interrogans serovar Icterohaemorrhagiae]